MNIDRNHRSPNFSVGRKGHKIVAIVEHITEGSAASCISWFTNPISKVSAHFLVGKDGQVFEFVAPEDTAWHAGRVQGSTWGLLQAGISPNLYCLGVEHEGQVGDVWTPEQVVASAALQFDLCKRFGIPIWRERFVEHRRIFSGKTCPGNLDVDRLFDLIVAASVVDGKPAEPVPGERRWSPGLKQYVYLIEYSTDAAWTFCTEKQLMGVPATQAGAPWSKMPAEP